MRELSKDSKEQLAVAVINVVELAEAIGIRAEVNLFAEFAPQHFQRITFEGLERGRDG